MRKDVHCKHCNIWLGRTEPNHEEICATFYKIGLHMVIVTGIDDAAAQLADIFDNNFAVSGCWRYFYGSSWLKSLQFLVYGADRYWHNTEEFNKLAYILKPYVAKGLLTEEAVSAGLSLAGKAYVRNLEM